MIELKNLSIWTEKELKWYVNNTVCFIFYIHQYKWKFIYGEMLTFIKNWRFNKKIHQFKVVLSFYLSVSSLDSFIGYWKLRSIFFSKKKQLLWLLMASPSKYLIDSIHILNVSGTNHTTKTKYLIQCDMQHVAHHMTMLRSREWLSCRSDMVILNQMGHLSLKMGIYPFSNLFTMHTQTHIHVTWMRVSCYISKKHKQHMKSIMHRTRVARGMCQPRTPTAKKMTTKRMRPMEFFL